MPVACNTSALTGQEGSIFFKPAGTKFCLLDYTDFPGSGSDITVPTDNDYRVGDAVAFYEEGTANLDGSLTASTTGSVTPYYITAIGADNNTITVAATSGGTAITLTGDGGTGDADIEPGPGQLRAPLDFACRLLSRSIPAVPELCFSTVDVRDLA